MARVYLHVDHTPVGQALSNFVTRDKVRDGVWFEYDFTGDLIGLEIDGVAQIDFREPEPDED